MPPRKPKPAARRKTAKSVPPKKAAPAQAVAPVAESGQTIAVTGLNRFLGNEMLRWLIADGSRRVIAIDIKRPQGEWPRNFVYYKVDLTDPIADQALSDIFKEEKVGTVLHAAFHDFPQPDSSQAHELESIGTMNVLHAVAGTQVRKLVVTSTTMVYGADPKNPTYLAEESPLLPTRTYSFISDKVDAERQLIQFRKQHPDKRVTILRFAPLVGPRGDHLMNHILSLPVVPRVMGFDPLMQLLHEDDAVDAIKKVLSEDHVGVFNIVPAQVLPFSTRWAPP
jgi:UDP-glucose 4-epimerase